MRQKLATGKSSPVASSTLNTLTHTGRPSDGVLALQKSVPAPRWFLFLVLNLERFGSQRILLLKKGCSLDAHRFQARAGWSRLEHKILHLKVYGFSAPINKRGRIRE